jgi:hypothetical protein
MSIPATDAFTAADNTVLTTYSANWTMNNSTMAITSNAVRGNGVSTDEMAHWNADIFATDQYSQSVLAGTPNGDNKGPCVRCASSAFTGYAFYAFDTVLQLYKISAGSFVLIASTSVSPSAGDLLRLEVIGNTLRCYRNGSLISALNGTDSTITSGFAGIATYSSSTGFRLDDFQGGHLASITAKVNVITTRAKVTASYI